MIDAGGPGGAAAGVPQPRAARRSPTCCSPTTTTTTSPSSTRCCERHPGHAGADPRARARARAAGDRHDGARARRSSPARCRSSRSTPPATPRGCCRCCSTAPTCSPATRCSRARSAACARPGSTSYADLKSSIMDTLLTLPPADAHPSRATPTRPRSPTSSSTTRFVRIWRGVDPEGTEPLHRAGRAGHADPARRRLRRRPQGLGPLARRRATTSSRAPRSSTALPGLVSPVAKDKIPTSRVGRTAKIGGLAAGQAIRQAGTRAANVARTEEGTRGRAGDAATSRPPSRSSTALGTMKGAAMKVGQVMSFLDVGLVPEEYREEFQRKLARAARRRPDGHLQGHAQGDRGGARRAARATSSTSSTRSRSRPRRSGRSTGRALHDGREVAVKVQYPGVAAAVRADMQNLGLILRLAKRIAPGHGPARRSARRSATRIERGARLRARGPEPALAGADLPRPPVHRHPRRRHLALPRAA